MDTAGGRRHTPRDRPVSLIRPYLLTSGRAEPVDRSLEIEAQVLTSPLGATVAPQLSFECRDIVDLCGDATSVAEVASTLGLHIGVARVLVADLAADGYVVLRRPDTELVHDVDIIERVIRGLQSIR